MSMSAALRDRLAPLADGRAYRDERPQGTPLPAIRLQVVSDPRPSTYDGREDARRTLTQIDCMASSRGEADALAEAVIAQAEPGAAVGAVRFLRAFVDSLRTYSDRDEAGETVFVTSLDLSIWHQPAA